MLNQARKILTYIRELDSKFGDTDDGLKALLLEKELNVILGREKPLGCWVREITDTELSVGHASCSITVKRTANNACSIYLEPFPDDHPNWKHIAKPKMKAS